MTDHHPRQTQYEEPQGILTSFTSGIVLRSGQEEARDLEALRQQNHEELEGMIASIGQSIVNVTSTVQAHAVCANMNAQRCTDGLVPVSREQTALRASLLDDAAPTLTASRAPKRLKTSVSSVVWRLVPEELQPLLSGDASYSAGASVQPSVRLDMLFYPIMEAELMDGRLTSSPRATQLERIVRLAHVSAGELGLFGSYAVHGLYERAGKEAATIAGPGAQSHEVNKEKQRRIKILILKRQIRTFGCCSGCAQCFQTCWRSQRGRRRWRQ